MSLLQSLCDLHRTCNSCQVRRCSKEGCELLLEEPSQVVCIDVDRCAAFSPNPEEKKPDYIILDARNTDPRWVVVEMKTQIRGHPEEIVEQLQEGARVVAEDRRFAVGVKRLAPVVLRKKGAHSQDLKVLQKKGVDFQGKRWPILVFRCGIYITEIR